MNSERWDTLSAFVSEWLAADAAGRARLREQLAAEHPDLVAEAEALADSSGELHGFLETPALVLEARSLAEEDPVLPAGALVGPYRVVALIARGGMGDVYRATDDRLRRDVALKVLAHARTADAGRLERFMQEARVTASLDHPNVVRVYDVARRDDQAYLVAELLDGETLRSRIERGPLPAQDAVRIAKDVASGLAAAHAAGLVHRDLKPDNIFLTRSGATKILDFGIAKLAEEDAVPEGFSTLTGVVLGTAGYLAPEQIRGRAIDGRADLFALGAVMFEMLTGTRAFGREHMVETLHAILHDPPPDVLAERADVPPALADVVIRLLEKSPDARFQSATDVMTALDAVGPNAPTGVTRRLRVPARRLRAARLAAALALLLILALAVVAYFGQPARRTLAIIPFRSIPAGADSELLETGLAAAFIGRLGQLEDIAVLPLEVGERLQRDADPIAAAGRVDATHVLTGTVQRAATGVRADIQLISVADRRTLWSVPVEVEAASAFRIQDVVVGRVLSVLAPQLAVATQRKIAQPGTQNSKAYEAYLRGGAHVFSARGSDLRKAETYFREALTLDPLFADAWAALGSAYKRMPVAGIGGRDALDKAADAADRALAIEADHPEALSVKGTVAFWRDWDYGRAEDLLRRALRFNPSSTDSYVFLAHVLSNVGRSKEALDAILSARQLDMQSPIPRALEGQFLLMAGRPDDALARLDEVVSLHPEVWQAHYFRVWTLIALRKFEEAAAGCDRLNDIRIKSDGRPHVGSIAHKAHALARLGRRAEAEALLDEVRRMPHPPHLEAVVLVALDRDDEAMAALRQMVDRGDPVATFLAVDPMWKDLRDRADFRELVARANLAEAATRISRSPSLR